METTLGIPIFETDCILYFLPCDNDSYFFPQAFEDYLVGLLQKPSLKESDILFTFLTSKEEFTLAATNLGLGKMIKNVPIKLTKERGQSLQTFIDSFLAQTQQPPPKPR